METNQPLSVFKTRYTTSLDERGYIPVYEYEINGQPILWDCETRNVFLTGIWKALGNTKVDIIKTVQANPNMKIKRIRGGLLKIQGTWISYDDARALCLHVAWIIRQQLVPLFGASFVEDCLPPDHPDYRVVCLDYLQLAPESFRKHPLLTRKRRYMIRAPSTPSLQYNSSISSPPSSPLLRAPFSPSSSPSPSPSPSFSSSSQFPMALSYILNYANNDDCDDSEYIEQADSNSADDDNTITDDGVVPEYDDYVDDRTAVSNTSPTLDFQVVPVWFSHSPPSPNLPPRANDWYALAGIATPLFNHLDDAIASEVNGIQDDIEAIQAMIILQGLSHQDRLTIRRTVPDRVTVNGREFSVLWD